MKKMITTIAMASAIVTGTVRADDEQNHDGDCAKPTQYVIQHLSRSGMPKSFGTQFITRSSDWVDRLKRGYLSNTNMIGDHLRTGELKQGLSEAEFDQHVQDIAAGNNVGHGKVAAKFEIVVREPNGLTVYSDIYEAEERPLFEGEDWETLKAEVERNGAEHKEEQMDQCSRCYYKFKVAMDEATKKVRIGGQATCITDISKDELIAKVMAERAAIEKLKAEIAKQ